MLDTLAREQADDLAPEEMINTARDFIAKTTSKRTGKPVAPAGMSISTSRAVTMDEFKAAEVREFALLAERFAHFSDGRAVVLAAWILPSLRHVFEYGAIDEVSRKMFQSPERLQELGSLALHDDDWEEFEARVRAGDRLVTWSIFNAGEGGCLEAGSVPAVTTAGRNIHTDDIRHFTDGPS